MTAVSTEHFDPRRLLGSVDDLSWRGRDGVVELNDGRLVGVVRGNVICLSAGAPDWVITREQLTTRLNDGVGDPVDRVDPRYASAPTLLPGDVVCLAIEGGIVTISKRGEPLSIARADLVDDSGDSPNVDGGGNVLVTTVDGDLLRWNASSAATEEVRTGLGYDLVSPAVLPDGKLLVSSYSSAGLCLLNENGATLWHGELSEVDLVPTFSHTSLCLGGSLNEELSVAVSIDGVTAWTFPQAAEFASHPNGILVSASASGLTALSSTGATLWTFPLPKSESRPLGHFICKDQTVVCATPHSCFAVAPPGRLSWSLEFEKVTSAPIPLTSGSIAMVADGRIVVIREPTMSPPNSGLQWTWA